HASHACVGACATEFVSESVEAPPELREDEAILGPEPDLQPMVANSQRVRIEERDGNRTNGERVVVDHGLSFSGRDDSFARADVLERGQCATDLGGHLALVSLSALRAEVRCAVRLGAAMCAFLLRAQRGTAGRAKLP